MERLIRDVFDNNEIYLPIDGSQASHTTVSPIFHCHAVISILRTVSIEINARSIDTTYLEDPITLRNYYV